MRPTTVHVTVTQLTISAFALKIPFFCKNIELMTFIYKSLRRLRQVRVLPARQEPVKLAFIQYDAGNPTG